MSWKIQKAPKVLLSYVGRWLWYLNPSWQVHYKSEEILWYFTDKQKSCIIQKLFHSKGWATGKEIPGIHVQINMVGKQDCSKDIIKVKAL